MSAIKKITSLLGVALALLAETPFRPRWAYYRARGYAFHYLLDRFHQDRVHEYRNHIRPWDEAVVYVTDCNQDELSALRDSNLIASMIIQDRWVTGFQNEYDRASSRESGPIETRYGPSPEHMKLVNLVCRLLCPENVLEAGVGKGFATTSVLDALRQNDSGHLYSVELPSLHRGYRDQVGDKVPEFLRNRWTLMFGPSAVAMPRVLAEISSLDVFIHDSGANYDNQMKEFELALAQMRPGGVLIAGQLNSNAFIEAAESVDCRWAVIEQGKPYPMGILCKLS